VQQSVKATGLSRVNASRYREMVIISPKIGFKWRITVLSQSRYLRQTFKVSALPFLVPKYCCDNEGENCVYWLWCDDCLDTGLKVHNA
jgi:hypothetical protein